MRKKIRRIILIGLVLVLLTASAAAADWPQFLGEADTQGVSGGKSPTSVSTLSLRWELNTGSSWEDMPGTPITVGDYVYYYSSQYLRKVELATGREVKKAAVYGKPVNQFFVDIAYGDGKIFVPCQTNNLNGEKGGEACFLRVYDAQTLKQLYITETFSKGLMESPVMYHDGCFVTGSYGRKGVYACFTSGDEDPSRSDEVKKALWTVNCTGRYGFCFNGAAFVGDCCYFGYDSTLCVVQYQTGRLRTVDIGAGHAIRSTITYSNETGRLYVASNHSAGGASVISYALGSDGMPDPSSAKEWLSGTKGGGTQSSPVVCNGRLYIGGGGYTMGSAEVFHVIDAVSMQEIYSVPVQTKGSAGISTAYAADDGQRTVYLYLVPYAPNADGSSELWIVQDSAGQTAAKYEIADGIGVSQYCSQSVLVAADGSLLWYNDAGRLYCYEKTAAGTDTPQKPAAAEFSDTKTHWARKQIAYLAEKRLIGGTGNGVFSPDRPLTRSQFVQMLAKLSGEDYSQCRTDAFTDVQAGDWFAPAVAWAVEKGIAAGSGSRTFSPDASITRQDMAVMLQRYLQNTAAAALNPVKAPLTFSDSASIAPYAAGAVSAMQQAGILSGIASGSGYRFAPAKTATRAEAAAMIYHLCLVLQGQDNT